MDVELACEWFVEALTGWEREYGGWFITPHLYVGGHIVLLQGRDDQGLQDAELIAYPEQIAVDLYNRFACKEWKGAYDQTPVFADIDEEDDFRDEITDIWSDYAVS